MFNPARPYRCSPSVALRPEPFGALAYHFGTRRLSFLKTHMMVRVVRTLADHPDVHAALDAAQVRAEQRPAYLRALKGLADGDMIQPRTRSGTSLPRSGTPEPESGTPEPESGTEQTPPGGIAA
ncbi:mycofactocin biosynthesis chaperone MftB [Streptomyces monticola]|uniref:Mycofactocin biosynthesis chaperone MftB n=1 Tax=Streptomyces monticola TaxID=2666263 RepID=A0ABW2JYG3_9ACTN